MNAEELVSMLMLLGYEKPKQIAFKGVIFEHPDKKLKVRVFWQRDENVQTGFQLGTNSPTYSANSFWNRYKDKL